MVNMPACQAGDRGFKSRQLRHPATVAQLVEQRTENPRVAGSIPARGTIEARPRKGSEVFYFQRKRRNRQNREILGKRCFKGHLQTPAIMPPGFSFCLTNLMTGKQKNNRRKRYKKL